MASIPFADLVTIVYVWVDDWYQSYCRAHPPQSRRGRLPALSVSEILTVVLSLDVVPFPSERGVLAFLRTEHSTLFPRLPALSQFNRQARAVRRLLEPLRQAWLADGAVAEEDQFILDTKPVPVGGMKRRTCTSDFLDSASYGYCAARQLHYFGYKLVLLTTVEGLPVVYDLVPAHTDERAAALSVLTRVRNSTMWADKGFIGTDWHAAVAAATGNRVWTAKRANQPQNPRAIDRLAGRILDPIICTVDPIEWSTLRL